MTILAAFCSASFLEVPSPFPFSSLSIYTRQQNLFRRPREFFFGSEMNIDFIFLSPLNQTAFIVGIDSHQILNIKEIRKDKLLYETFGISKPLIQDIAPIKASKTSP